MIDRLLAERLDTLIPQLMRDDVADIIAARDPANIAINVSDTARFGDGMKPGENEVPAGLTQGLINSNRVPDILREEMRAGLSGNAILAAARERALAEGLDLSIYSHPIGYHGHGAGTAIGFWNNQGADPRG